MAGNRGSARAAEIIEAAAGLFAQKGFDGVSVRDICSALDVNSSIVSYYFGGKKGLYLAVLRRLFQILASQETPSAPSSRSPREKLEALIANRFEAARRMPWLAGLLWRESGRPSLEFQQIRLEFRAGGQLIEIILEGQRQGQFKAGRAELLAELMEAMLNAAGPEAGADYLAALKALVFEGLDAARVGAAEPRPAIGKQSAVRRDRFGPG